MSESAGPPSAGPTTAAPDGAAPTAALSFGPAAAAYERSRPTYPRQAAQWLVAGASGPSGGPSGGSADLLELGAGTGKLTEQLGALGHRVLATDPLEAMLHRLVDKLPHVPVARAAAERIPVRSRSVDAVLSAQAFHWFDCDRALPEIARVLRPGGHLGLVWNLRDERIPWVKRLGALLGRPQDNGPQAGPDPTHALLSSNLFGYVETTSYRHWQPLDRERLRDLVRSRSHVATLDDDAARERVLEQVDRLYDDYGRGPDGMLLPYVTHCYKAVVRPRAIEEDEPAQREAAPRPAGRTDDGGDADALLIDFQ